MQINVTNTYIVSLRDMHFASFQVQVVLFVCTSGSTVPVDTLKLNHLLSLSQHDLALRSKENREKLIMYPEAAVPSGLGTHE